MNGGTLLRESGTTIPGRHRSGYPAQPRLERFHHFSGRFKGIVFLLPAWCCQHLVPIGFLGSLHSCEDQRKQEKNAERRSDAKTAFHPTPPLRVVKFAFFRFFFRKSMY